MPQFECVIYCSLTATIEADNAEQAKKDAAQLALEEFTEDTRRVDTPREVTERAADAD